MSIIKLAQNPLYASIHSKLTAEETELLINIVDHAFHLEDDVNYAYAKLDGTWPNWEWIIEEKEKRNLV